MFVMLLFGIFMPDNVSWFVPTTCHAGQPLIWWPARVNKHAWLHRELGCLSQGLSTHDMTWHLDPASAPWPGYLLRPLSLMLGPRWIGMEAEAIAIVASFGCQTNLKDRLSVGHHGITSSCNSTCRWSWKEKHVICWLISSQVTCTGISCLWSRMQMFTTTEKNDNVVICVVLHTGHVKY